QQLKPTLYDGSVIGKSDVIVVPDSENSLMHAEESRSKMIEKQNDPQMIEKKTESYAEQAFWSQYSVQTDEPNHSGTTIVEVPKELPKVNMEKDTVILKLKKKLKSFSGDVKERKSVEVFDLNASLQEKVLVIIALKEQLKGKAVLTKVVSLNLIDPALLQVDVASLNRSIIHLRYGKTSYELMHVDQDAPSPSKSPTPTEIQSLVILQDVGNGNLDIEVAHMGNDPLLGVPITEVASRQSSSTASPQSNVQPNYP
nr:hypothetical protein [Tanacetum cinerariifolium]